MKCGNHAIWVEIYDGIAVVNELGLGVVANTYNVVADVDFLQQYEMAYFLLVREDYSIIWGLG